MSYRNDPYDPKQVAQLDQASLDDAVVQAQKAFAGASDMDALAALRHQHLGDRSPVSLARREIGALPPHAKADAGKRVNEARSAIQTAYDARLEQLQAERAKTVLVGRGSRRHAAVGPSPARARGTRSPRSWSGSGTCSSAWATRSPRVPRSSSNGPTSMRSTSLRIIRRAP